MNALDQILERFAEVPQEDQETLLKEVNAKYKDRLWFPNPGPQTDAYFCEADELFYGGQAGGGKVVKDLAKVLTPFGWKFGKDLRVGDTLCHPSGAHQKIIQVHPETCLPDVTVKFADGTETTVAEDHLWQAWRSGKYRKVQGGKLCAEAEVVETRGIRAWLETARDQESRGVRPAWPLIPVCDEQRFNRSERHPINIEPYLLGQLLGDGHIGEKSIGITSGDIDHMHETLQGYNYAFDGVKAFRFRGDSFQHLRVELSRCGLLGMKSRTKFIPKSLLWSKLSTRYALAQGLMDSDGGVEDGRKTTYTTISESLANDAAFLFRSLGSRVTITSKIPVCTNAPGGPKECDRAYRLHIKHREPGKLFRLERKRALAEQIPQTPMYKRVTDIVTGDPSPGRCITVSNPDGLYITDDFIVTHNSALICGLSVEEHERTLILRRINKDAKKLAEAELLGNIFNGNRNGWNGTDLIYRDKTQTIEFAGCENEQDKQRFKGDPHDLICVGRGTPVLMGDNTYRPVESLVVGDMVQTLEGPRALERVHPIQQKACVKITSDGVSQIQSVTHPVLTLGGWSSADDLDASCVPSQSHGVGRQQLPLQQRYASASRTPSKKIDHLPQKAGLFRQFQGLLSSVVMIVFGLRSAREIACAAYYGHNQQSRRPALSYGLQALPQRLRALFSPFERRLAFEHGAGDALAGLGQLGWMGRCSSGLHQYDGRTRQSSGLGHESVAGLQCLLLRDDAEPPTPNRSLDRAPGETQKHSPEPQRMYDHPYTGEKRQVALSGCLRAYGSSIEYVGERQVFDLQVAEVNHYITKGGFVNKNCFDEVPEFLESQYVFISTWNRSTNPNQRCRIVATGNPPTTAEGLWVIKRWAPWLDDRHPNPAKPGELRWFISDEEGEDVEVDGPGPHLVGDREVYARSRTFIPAELDDNPDLAADGEYGRLLDSLPKELRDAYRDGKFRTGLKDNPWQVIPTEWVLAAQDRWTQYPPEGVPMCAIGLDVAQGGDDTNVLAARYDSWFAELERIPGKETPLGVSQAGLVVSHRRDKAKVIIDCDGGYGGTAYKDLQDNGVDVVAYKGSEGSARKSLDGTLGFYNKRAETMWRFREALDPAQPGGSPIALPEDTALLADLTAPHYSVVNAKIKVESKADIKKRLGRSPDDGDAVTMCWSDGAKTSTHYHMWGPRRTNKTPKVVHSKRMNQLRRR